MKVLLIGSGGREHALAWKLRQSPRLTELHCAPGNPGMAEFGQLHAADASRLDDLLRLASELQPDLTVVGPELPLSLGIVDEFTRRGLRIFGPTQAAARLETSKSFAKEFMQRHHIPTARYAVCSDEAEIREALTHFRAPVVVKADGLAAGKGVVIASTKEEAAQVAAEMLSGRVAGQAGARVVLEEFLEGEELSFLVLSDGHRVAAMAPAQDHKRAYEGDTGPNTGGMGAYSEDSLLDPQMREWLLAHVAQPVVDGMRAEGAEFRGVLYCGLMMTATGPMVLEFNCRFGDPETQPLLLRLESDLLEAFEASIEGRVSEGIFRWSSEPALCVVLASGGYPGEFKKGLPISGVEEAAAVEGVQVFHAGTAARDGQLVTSGGRVFGVTARAASLAAAAELAYQAAARIRFEGMHFRRDIGARALQKR